MLRNETMWAEITTEELDPLETLDFVRHDAAGGIDVFLGTVRNRNDGRAVGGLQYQGYPEMGEKLLVEIIGSAFDKWPLQRAAARHRLGRLAIRETAVIIAVAGMHRAEAFQACRYIIDEIKQSLPIWKKEEYLDGETAWVRCNHHHPNVG